MLSTTSKRLLVALVVALVCLIAQPVHALPSLFGTAANPTDAGTKTGATDNAITPPGSMTAGMLACVFGFNRSASNSFGLKNTVTGGQLWQKMTLDQGLAHFETTNLSEATWCTIFNGTWAANPEFSTNGTTTSFTTVMLVFSPDSGKRFDLDCRMVGEVEAAAATFTVGQITTRTANTIAIAAFSSTDDNTWNALTATWTVAGSAQYRNNANMSATFGYKVVTSAGATGTVSTTEATLGNDNGLSMLLAFRQVDVTTTIPDVDIIIHGEDSTNGTALTPTILGNMTAGTGWTWSDNGGPGLAAFKVATAGEFTTFPRMVSRASTNYNDSSDTRGIEFDHSVNVATSSTFLFNRASTVTEASFGYLFKTNVTPPANWTYTLIGFGDAGGVGACYFNFETNLASGYDSYVEDGNFHIWHLADIAASTEYWISVHVESTPGICEVSLHDPSNGYAQIGFRNVGEWGSGAGAIDNFQWGQPGGGFATTSATHSYFDDIVIATTTPTFPLVPGLAAGGGSGTSMFTLIGAGR